VISPKNANDLMALALKYAVTKREPTHLIFPDEVQVLPEASPPRPSPYEGRVPDFAIEPPEAAVARAIEVLRGAKRPVLVLGHGARPFAEWLIRFAERIDAPCITTFKAKGAIPDTHPLGCGVLGRSGTPVASWFMNESDVLLVLGASFSKHTGITTHKTLVQVDSDPMNLGKFHPVDVPVWGDIGRTLDLLDAALPDASRGSASEVAARWAIWREEKRKRAKDDRGLGLPAAFVFQQLSNAVPESAVLAVDVGNNTYSFGRYFESKGQPVLMSGYLGSIGFGLPAAMGAWAAVGKEGRKAVCVCGDGGLGQYLADFTTTVKYGMDLMVLVLDNGQLGKISKEQRAGDYPVWETSLKNPDFAAFAELCGGKGFRVEKRKDLKPALDAAMAHRGPSLVAVKQDAQLM
jgi:thiamine pyrophosphate-dependent acetolactate synthase large subunit-like protein